MNNQILINSVNELGFKATARAINELFSNYQLISYKHAIQLMHDLNELNGSIEFLLFRGV